MATRADRSTAGVAHPPAFAPRKPIGSPDFSAKPVDSAEDLNVLLDRANESLRRTIDLAESIARERQQALQEMAKRERRIDRKIAANARLLQDIVREPPHS
jgi:FixJ family two-component response regulator